jgi:tol-pal system protein YbgF
MRRRRSAVALILIGLAGGGCATRSSVGDLERELSALRAQLTEVRVTQDLVSADLARTLAELRSLDARAADAQATLDASSAELARLRARLDATEAEVRQVRATMPLRTTSAPAPPSGGPPPAAVQFAPEDAVRRPQPGGAESAEDAYAAALNTFRAREHGQAVLDFLDFIARHPAHALAPHAQYWIGEAYFVQRDYRHAVVEFRRVLEMAPASPRAADALLRIGMCHATLGESARAVAAWQRVARDYPRSDAAGTAGGLLRARASTRRR